MKIATLLLCSLPIFAQTSQVPDTFEVASIKPSDPKEVGQFVQFLPGGRFVVSNCMLSSIILEVYGLKDYQLVDAPKWISDWAYRYDIQAKTTGPANPEQLRLMAQELLAERFHLKVHRETREKPVYFLIAAKNGLRLKATADRGKPARRGGIEFVSDGVRQGTNVTMAQLVRVLSRDTDRPILDKTAFTETFDFRLEWAPGNAPPADDNRASLFVAVQEQLGLKLEPQKAPVEVLVIDHAEKPSAN